MRTRAESAARCSLVLASDASLTHDGEPDEQDTSVLLVDDRDLNDRPLRQRPLDVSHVPALVRAMEAFDCRQYSSIEASLALEGWEVDAPLIASTASS